MRFAEILVKSRTLREKFYLSCGLGRHFFKKKRRILDENPAFSFSTDPGSGLDGRRVLDDDVQTVHAARLKKDRLDF